MTKEEALKDLKSIANAVSVMGENHALLGLPISKFVVQSWILRLGKIIAALEA
jgi:hypothetical protein